MTSAYRRDHIKGVRNDEFEALAEEGRMAIVMAVAAFQATVGTPGTPNPSSGEGIALMRAMARYLIDSGIASARGWV